LHLVEGLLIAILDIDEVIEVIRSSDDSEAARSRLQTVFDLSEVQAEYILELRLRRLTKFSRLELEGERDQLLADIAALEELLSSDERLRAQVSLELTEVSDRFATPRRTLLTEADAPVRGGRKAAVDPESLQIADSPCRVILSTTGRLVRVDIPDTDLGIVRVPKRSKHDAVRSSVVSTVRGQLGALTSTGRVVRFSPVDVPAVPPASVRLDAGVRVSEYLGVARTETVVALISLGSDDSVAIGTAQGVVKRVVAGAWPDKPEVVAIGLKPGDSVIGATQAPEDDDLVFITSNAQLLRFPASGVRPQGLPAGGVAGVALASGASVIWFGSVPRSDDAVVATVSTSSAALPGTDNGRAKVSALSEFPAKGRATQGVRAHAFLKGEDGLTVAWAGIAPPHAVGTDGAARTLPDWLSKRDGSGSPLDAVIGTIGGSAAALDGTAGEA
ncbi:MAG: DNA gyrase subunit A, partial [Curtobacterium sp.]